MQSIIIQKNILDDGNDICSHINNDSYTFNSKSMANYCIKVNDCCNCLTIFDITDNDIIQVI